MSDTKNQRLPWLYLLFLAMTMMPFIIPNPVITTNIQPYSALLGTIILLQRLWSNNKFFVVSNKDFYHIVSFFTLFVSIVVMLVWGINLQAFRAVYNYYAVAIIPCATVFVLSTVDYFPEKEIKILILAWFFVASVQLFVNRSFMTSIIGGVNLSYSYRGVVGLGSEPSFLGIACFYFLHMIRRFKTQQGLYMVLVIIMGVVYAQSAMGIVFILAYMIIYLLEYSNTLKGFLLFVLFCVAIVAFLIIINTFLKDSRIYQLVNAFFETGLEGVLADESATTRSDAISHALQDAYENNFIPLGYSRRIGSGYGGFLCELGVFAFPIIISVSYYMSISFKKSICKILYFVIFTLLMLNNTQVGNPLLLFVIGTNLYFRRTERGYDYDEALARGGLSDAQAARKI